jgi:hypothetical protein
VRFKGKKKIFGIFETHKLSAIFASVNTILDPVEADIFAV